jgi:hypothetical protein
LKAMAVPIEVAANPQLMYLHAIQPKPQQNVVVARKMSQRSTHR